MSHQLSLTNNENMHAKAGRKQGGNRKRKAEFQDKLFKVILTPEGGRKAELQKRDVVSKFPPRLNTSPPSLLHSPHGCLNSSNSYPAPEFLVITSAQNLGEHKTARRP